MGTFEQEKMPSLISTFSEAVLSGGSWLFPIGLLLITFMLKCFVCKRISGINFYRALVVLPIEIKTVACSFVFASAVLQPSNAIGLLSMAIVGLFVLAMSIGFYNYLEMESVDQISSVRANVYLVLSLFISANMLHFSILVMQVSEVAK